MPYISVNNQTGTNNPLFAQVWWPSLHRNNNYLFTDINGGYSPVQHNSNAEIGLDVRHLFSERWALGFYNYAAFNCSENKQRFFTWNPGIEFLNNRWQVNWDAYVPLPSSNQASGDWVWADSVGIYKYIHFSGHNQYNQRVQATASTGTGTDLIVSYRFNKLFHLKASLGSYYFDMPNHPVGFLAMMTTPARHHLSFSLSATHDPLTRNSINFGITLHFGNTNDSDQQWINQPVQHNLPLTVGANSIPISTNYKADGIDQLQKDNVWFFDSSASAFDPSQGLNNCTAEHPCSGLSIANLAHIASNSVSAHFSDDPSIYLKPGTYANGTLLLFDNESLIGRSSDYTRDATGDERAHINTDSIIIDSSLTRNNTLANLQLTNIGNLLSAVSIVGTQHTTLDNVLIGPNSPSSASEGYYSDINIVNADNVTINNSTLNANNALATSTLTPSNILASNVNKLEIDNSTLNASANGAITQGASGITLLDNANITINNSIFNQTAYGDTSQTFNINATKKLNANVSINNSTLNTFTSSLTNNRGAFNIVLTGSSHLNINNSNITGQGNSDSGLGYATNITLADSASATINNSHLLSVGHSAAQSGNTNITTSQTANATLNNSVAETDMAGGPQVTESSGAVPLWALNTSTITVNNSIIIARSLNSDTSAAPVQAQGASGEGATINVNNSRLYAYTLYGNTTHSDSTVVIAGNNSHINLNNNAIYAYSSGSSPYNLNMVTAIGNSQITLNNNRLYAINHFSSSSGNPIATVGLSATGTSIIYNQGTLYNLTGNPAITSQTSDSGQIINQ